MSKEYANQQVREDNFEIAGLVKLNAKDIDRLCQTHEALKFVPVDDCAVLIAEGVRLLMDSVGKKTSEVTCGIEADMVRSIMCALLRVPASNMSFLEDSDLKLQTNDEVKAFKAARLDASRIAKKLTPSNGQNVNYEEYIDLISKAVDPRFAQHLLLAAKPGDAPIKTPSGTELPAILPPPKTLTSKSAVTVRLKILCVDEGSFVASVQILTDDSAEHPALAGLIGKTLPMEFSAKKPAMRNLLIGMQLIKKSAVCKVTVVRALRSGDAKLTALRLIKCLSNESEQKEVRDELSQIDLDFGSVEAPLPDWLASN